MPAALTIEHLSKHYGKHRVLDGVDLTVRPGSVHALLRRNGAGKTTLIRIASTLERPDGGTVRIGEIDVATEPARARGVLAVAGQQAAVDDALTVTENLRLVAGLRKVPRPARAGQVADLIERFDLTGHRNQRASKLSGGTRRRLDIAMSLLGDPQLLFLDEPSTGLDPVARAGLWAQIRALAASGLAVLLTTQYLEEAAALADEISILAGGRIVAHGSPNELTDALPGQQVVLTFERRETAEAAATRIADELRSIDLLPATLTVTGPPLEDAFTTLTTPEA